MEFLQNYGNGFVFVQASLVRKMLFKVLLLKVVLISDIPCFMWMIVNSLYVALVRLGRHISDKDLDQEIVKKCIGKVEYNCT